MPLLIENVQNCRSAKTLDQKLALSEVIIGLVGPPLQQFIALESAKRGCVEECGEAYQETLIAIVTNLDRFQGSSCQQFWSWCYQIARYKLIDVVRKLASAKTVSMDREALEKVIDEAAALTPVSPGEAEDLEFALHLLGTAKAPCVDYLWTHYILGWTYEEISDSYALPYDTVRMKLKRCLELAQKLMAGKI
jgi:RNA polymerase sigma factor (sigma-70 family)